MDYSSLKFFNLKYSLFSDYYKENLHNLLDNSFDNLLSYELHDYTMIQGFTLGNEIIATLSLLNYEQLKLILKDNNNDEFNGYSKKGENGLFIYNIAVHPDYRRKKLSEILLRKLIKESNSKHLHCQVKKDNEASYNLFFKCGFKIEEEMFDGENLIVCVLSKDI